MSTVAPGDIMSVNEVAKFLGVSRAYVYLLIQQDALHPIQPEESILKQPPKRFERDEVVTLRESRLQEKRAG